MKGLLQSAQKQHSNSDSCQQNENYSNWPNSNTPISIILILIIPSKNENYRTETLINQESKINSKLLPVRWVQRPVARRAGRRWQGVLDAGDCVPGRRETERESRWERRGRGETESDRAGREMPSAELSMTITGDRRRRDGWVNSFRGAREIEDREGASAKKGGNAWDRATKRSCPGIKKKNCFLFF